MVKEIRSPKNRKKAIILTLPLENNYGGLLQAYALQRVVSELGLDVCTDRYASKNKSWKNFFLCFYLPIRFKILELQGKKPVTPKLLKYRYKLTQEFVKKYIKTTNFFKGRSKPPKKVVNSYDFFIVGSDQVWRKEYVRVQSYLLDFLCGCSNKKKIAYAASFGVDNIDEWSRSDILMAKELFPQFSAISVREEGGCNLLKKEFNIDSEVVLDPTMLLMKQDYATFFNANEHIKKTKMLYCYILDLNDDKRKLIEQIKKDRNINEVLFISAKMDKVMTNLPDDYVYPSVEEWLAGFRDADFVLTDSYHGTVFSILFNKQFICYANKSRGLSRFDTLLGDFNLKDKIIFSSQEYSRVATSFISYDEINKILDDKRCKSINFLKNSINK